MKTLGLLLLLLLLLTFSSLSFAQVGIGTVTPDQSSVLDVTSTTQGFLPPRLTTLQRDAIVNPADGLTIYNVTVNCLETFNGTEWYNYCTGSSTARCGYNDTVIVEVTSATGRIWMDRNLGATQVATSSTDADAHGHLYQWGRGSDCHELRTSGTNTNLSLNDEPGHDEFIMPGDNVNSNDWRSGQNPLLWQGVNGTNNPCPTGFRVPTATEWDAEHLTWSSDDAIGAFASILKLTLSGNRDDITGAIENTGTRARYWSSSVGTSVLVKSKRFGIDVAGGGTGMGESFRGNGFSVRCIKN